MKRKLAYAQNLIYGKDVYEELNAAIRAMNGMLYSDCIGEDASLSLDLTRLVQNGGKRLRPSLAWICARMGEKKSYEILPLMCMLELMHTTSLIHDDVVDDGKIRRGIPTINSQKGNERAVQAGDFLLAKAMEYLPIYKGTGINEALSWLSGEMCMGELDQMRDLFDAKAQTVERYFERINRKTAYFLATACYTGALAGGMDPEKARALQEYGQQIGVAFQLKDDILDFVGKESFGKKLGQDLKRGLYTLPVCYALEGLKEEDEVLQLAQKEDKDQEEFQKVFRYILDSDGIEKTEQKVKECSDKAIETLTVFEESTEKKLLIEMAQVLCQRKK